MKETEVSIYLSWASMGHALGSKPYLPQNISCINLTQLEQLQFHVWMEINVLHFSQTYWKRFWWNNICFYMVLGGLMKDLPFKHQSIWQVYNTKCTWKDPGLRDMRACLDWIHYWQQGHHWERLVQGWL